jgi:hypothetical protein
MTTRDAFTIACRIENATPQTVVITTLNYHQTRDESKERKISLAPGNSNIFHTHVAQRLAATDVSGKCLGVYDATEEQSLAVIK